MDKKYLIINSNFTGEDLTFYLKIVNGDYLEYTRYKAEYDKIVQSGGDSYTKNYMLDLMNKAKVKYEDSLKIYKKIETDILNAPQATNAVLVAGQNPYYHDGIDYSTLSIQGYNDLLKKFDDEINHLQTDYNISKQAGVSESSLSLKLKDIEANQRNKEIVEKYKAQFHPEPVKSTSNSQAFQSQIKKEGNLNLWTTIGAVTAGTLIVVTAIAWSD